tara:strand:- start:1048 stop:1467 length:420 start_codon:yes stop_codon:yes gene_type:complete
MNNLKVNPSYCLYRKVGDDILTVINSYIVNPYNIYKEHSKITYYNIISILNSEFYNSFLTWHYEHPCCSLAMSLINEYDPHKFKLDYFVSTIKTQCPEYSSLKKGRDLLLVMGCITSQKWKLLCLIDKTDLINKFNVSY